MSFRPEDVGTIFGQEHIIELVNGWIQNPASIPQSLLISGPFGCGKTTIARMLAAKLCTNKSDIIEMNSAESRGIDDVRRIAETCSFMSWGSAKVYIIDELHQMTAQAQNALLKVIEEPPKGTYFILCTAEPSKLLPAIRSRCSKIEVKKLLPEAAYDLIAFLSKGKIDQETCDKIYNLTDGHARDIVKIVELIHQNGVVDVSKLSNSISTMISPNFISKVIKEWIGNKRINQNDYVAIINSGDISLVANMVDNFVDSNFLQYPELTKNYSELLMMRVYRKEYKVDGHDQLRHFLSVLYREWQ